MRALALLALTALPLHAQSAKEAAQQNVAIAMQVCIQNYHDPQTMLNVFQQAGFTYSPEDFGGGNILHWFADPAATMSTAIVISNGALECRISSDLISVPEAIPLAGQTIPKFFSGEIFAESPEGETIQPGHPQASGRSCSGYHFFAPQRLIWVQIGNAGQDPVCIDDGSSQIMMMM